MHNIFVELKDVACEVVCLVKFCERVKYFKTAHGFYGSPDSATVSPTQEDKAGCLKGALLETRE
jgi:hypothetical protein